ncbi:MAG TPA: cytochrome P450 [Candidatus Nitrosocosmicus sp.]|nr:cytochrome P450 [Candidatus Nitrosocosmicus sp.]
MKHDSNSNMTRKDYEYPPGPTEIFPYSLALKFISNPLPILEKITLKYGDISHFKFGPRLHVYLVNNPYLIENILVRHNQYFIKSPGLQLAKRVIGNGLITNEGESHSKQRRLVQQAFTRDKIEAYGKILAEHCIEYTNANWKDGTTVNIHKEMTKLTLSIISKLLFGNNSITVTEIDHISDNITLIIEFINKLRLPFLRFIEKLPIPSTLEYKQALKQLDKTIYTKINLERQDMSHNDNKKFNKYDTYNTTLREHNNLKKHTSKSNILSILINSTDIEATHDDEKSLLDSEKRKEELLKMTDKQLRDEVMTIFLAGHETTANALTWTLYLLSCHPNIEVKILEEIALITNDKEGNNSHKEIITVEDLPRLKYTEKVLMESMRLYPPSWAIGRQAVKDYPLNDNYTIPSGAVVIMSQYLMHRDIRYFTDPEKFVPERWTSEFKTSIPRFSYFPFGGGPRSCIGEPLAWSEGIIVLANVINKWKITLGDKKTNVELQPLVTLRPKNGIRMIMSKR